RLGRGRPPTPSARGPRRRVLPPNATDTDASRRRRDDDRREAVVRPRTSPYDNAGIIAIDQATFQTWIIERLPPSFEEIQVEMSGKSVRSSGASTLPFVLARHLSGTLDVPEPEGDLAEPFGILADDRTDPHAPDDLDEQAVVTQRASRQDRLEFAPLVGP